MSPITGIGAPLRRIEDARFLTGRGRYVDDIRVPELAHAVIVRSPHAHARLGRIDTGAARAAPGVLGVLTAEDLARDGIGAMPCYAFPAQPQGARFHRPLQPLLATGKVRHVGEAVAIVVADSAARAKDAAELVAIEYEGIAPATLVDALADGAAKVWDDAPGNVSFEIERGDRKAVERAFASAAHVTELELHYPRASSNTLEPRAVLAVPEAMGRGTIYSSAQSPHQVKEVVCALLGLPMTDVRVVGPDIGGAFGMKARVYPEEVLLPWAAGKVGRAVKWTAERSEALASDQHGRHQLTRAALALDAHGRILALRAQVAIDLGAYLTYSAGVPPNNAAVSYVGTYAIALVHARVRAAFTNTSPVGPYRGSAKPEASYVTERLVDKAARELGIDAVEMRRRNLIAPSTMPFRSPSGHVYDSGDFPGVLEKAVRLADSGGFAARRAESERRGLRRGRGIAMHCQRAGNQSERMEIRVAQDGTVALHVGTLATGQGHETMFAQMASQWLGVPCEKVRVFQGDTETSLYGRGTFAQRSMISGGSALKLAADEVIRKGTRFAAWMLEAPEADIEFTPGAFRVKGTDRQVPLAEVAKRSYHGFGVPVELGVGLDGVGSHPGPDTFPNGCMVCEVEVDPETGAVRVDRLASVDDAGTVINPVTLEGQLHGSIAHGLGETLMESVVYDPDTGQLVTGSFMDYAMPRADTLPDIVSEVAPVPAKTNPLGVKGGSEAGNVAMPAAIVNAIVDALAPYAVKDVPLPATAERIWRLLNAR